MEVTGYIYMDSLNDYHKHGEESSAYHIVKAQVMGQENPTYALVDKDKNYIVKPQTRYSLLNGTVKGNWMIVGEEGKYAVTDIKLNILVPPMDRMIHFYFNWQGKNYVYGSKDPNVPYNPGNCYNCYCSTLLNADGNIAKGFKPYCEPRFFTNTEYFLTTPKSDILTVKDSLMHIGFMKFDGTILYPGISFKYEEVFAAGPNTLFCKGKEYKKQMLDSLGNEYVPGLLVSDHYYIMNQQLARYSRTTIAIPNIFKIQYNAEDGWNRQFYVDHRGNIYADLEAVAKDIRK